MVLNSASAGKIAQQDIVKRKSQREVCHERCNRNSSDLTSENVGREKKLISYRPKKEGCTPHMPQTTMGLGSC
jgi:hypothetical protein